MADADVNFSTLSLSFFFSPSSFEYVNGARQTVSFFFYSQFNSKVQQKYGEI